MDIYLQPIGRGWTLANKRHMSLKYICPWQIVNANGPVIHCDFQMGMPDCVS